MQRVVYKSPSICQYLLALRIDLSIYLLLESLFFFFFNDNVIEFPKEGMNSQILEVIQLAFREVSNSSRVT